jgi:hypothetical protein
MRNLNHYITLLLQGMFIILLWACFPKEEKEEVLPPDFEVYDESHFASILFDLTLAESVFRLNMADQTATENRGAVFQLILANHRTDSLTFNQNWNYYGGEPDRMADVYEQVGKLAEIEKKKWISEQVPEPNKNGNE